MGQDENWGGVCCKGKGWRDGVEHKEDNNQENEERVGGMFPGCDVQEAIIISTQKCAEERYEFLFAFVFMFKRGG